MIGDYRWGSLGARRDHHHAYQAGDIQQRRYDARWQRPRGSACLRGRWTPGKQGSDQPTQQNAPSQGNSARDYCGFGIEDIRKASNVDAE